jgi:hexosaminidase
MHGIETLLQLLKADGSGYAFPAVTINDQPRFQWRGLMIDGSRHFMPVDVIKRNIDALSAVKMNVFHWHLSDDQGFRVECKALPKLNTLASDGLYYTQEEVKNIIKYANDRGIRVIPEFDIPGHSTSWLTAYPELASAPGPYSIERNWGVFDPTFNPTIEATYEFFDKFFAEMCALFNDEYMHIGGDENSGKQWNNNAEIQAFMKAKGIKDNHQLQSYFNQRILKILTNYGKKMIGWDEILHPDMPNNIVIQSWRGTKSLVESAQKGYMGLLSNGYYIDLCQPASFHYLNDPLPADSPLSESEKKFILGGEATMWAELVTPENVDSRIWPRTAAIAERFWSQSDVRDVKDMYRRLDIIGYQLEEVGITTIKNQTMMMRRLTGNNPVQPLKNLIDFIEPLKEYERHSKGVTYTQYSPYTRVVDAAMPEANVAREFNELTDEFLATGNDEAQKKMNYYLSVMQNNDPVLAQTASKSPVLSEIMPLSYNLSQLGITGLEAVEYILKGRDVTDAWYEGKMRLIENAKKSYGQVEIAVIPAIEKLVKKAAKK